MTKTAVPPTRAPSTDSPQISVVMPVHNALPHLDQAVESILAQTFGGFEFVIFDDGSTDGSTERLRYWASKDPRIRLFEVEKNLGPALSSDRVARAASAPVVARMDADDISYPTRLEEQLAVLDSHADAGVVGGLYDVIDANGRRIRKAEPWRLVQRSVFPPFGNGPMMYRKEVFEAVGGYRQACEYWEDQDLLIRMSAISKILVIPHAVYQVRQSPASTRFASEQARVERAVDLMYRSRDRLEQGEAYDDLLNESRPATAKLDPRVFISLGAVFLWAGGKPRLFRRLLKRGNLSFNFPTASALVWTAWASINPSSLRAFLRSIFFARNLYASAKVKTDRPLYWSPSRKRRVGPNVAESRA
jgi:glycosyltransferase involved in cell wall biosynthesis